MQMLTLRMARDIPRKRAMGDERVGRCVERRRESR